MNSKLPKTELFLFSKQVTPYKIINYKNLLFYKNLHVINTIFKILSSYFNSHTYTHTYQPYIC